MNFFIDNFDWHKRGLIITPQKDKSWMQTHAMTPTIDHLEGDNYRIYFCGRDIKNRSIISFANVLVSRGEITVLNYSKEPALGLGRLGCFDDNGVTPSSIVTVGKKKYLYYIGWNQGATVRMHLYGGLAISDNSGKTFHRFSESPILDRTRINPFLNTSPFVLKDKDIWRMYYVAGVDWVNKDLPRYNIQYAESSNGIDWQRDGKICLDFQSPDEVALARPYVIKEKGLYKMWFCHKGSEYAMGYAESSNGIDWQRKDDLANLVVSKSGWDSQMVAYPCVFKHQNYYYFLYNGNNYGLDGIGYAVHKNI